MDGSKIGIDGLLWWNVCSKKRIRSHRLNVDGSEPVTANSRSNGEKIQRKATTQPHLIESVESIIN